MASLPPMETFDALRAILARLRGPGGCPWDKDQTHSSLRSTLLEECYEALEALDAGDHQRLAEELGDILLQVAFHCQIATEKGEFTYEEVVHRLNEKLLRRHPHVFGGATASTPWEVEEQWERLREREKGGGSLLDGVPKTLPALAYAQAVSQRAVRAGFEWPDLTSLLDKVKEEWEELHRAASLESREREMGDLLFSVVNLARWLGVEAESALRKANARFTRRFAAMEEAARARGTTFTALPLSEKLSLWREAKRQEGTAGGPSLEE